MRKFASVCISIFLFAACGGDDGSTTGDDVVEPDAETGIDAEIEPDADTSCTTDTACVGETNGATLCMGNGIVTCTANGDCLDATTVPCTGTDVCVDDGSPACEALAGDGESCATALVITADTTLAGADFAADYADDHDFTDASCDGADPEAPSAEAVFSVALAANQRITVTDDGGIDTVMGVQQTCGNAIVCLEAEDDPDTITYVAGAATTVFIYVGAYEAVPTPADYSLAFDFSACGDGIVDTDFDEQCDDSDIDSNDGCSSECLVEFGYNCDAADPTVCTALPTLGSHAGGATISHTGGALALNASAFFTVTFTVPVRVTGTLTATGGAEDPDFYTSSPAFQLYAEEEVGTVENVGNEIENYYTAGTYIFEVYAYTALTGYTINFTTAAVSHIDLGNFAAAATITPITDSDGFTAGSSAYFEIEFTAPVLLDGTLTSTGATGDMDLYWWRAGDAVFSSATAGNQTVTDEPLAAGTYFFVVNAFFSAGNADTWTLSLSTTAP